MTYHGPYAGKQVKTPFRFHKTIINSDDRDLVTTILSLVLSSQDRKEIHVEVRENDTVFKLLFFNGKFPKDVQTNILKSFSDIWIKLPQYTERFSIKQTVPRYPMYYDTNLVSEDIEKTKIEYTGCIVVEVLKDWRSSLIPVIQELKLHSSDKLNRILTAKSGKLGKTTGRINKSSDNYQKVQRVVQDAMKERSIGIKILDTLFGVDESNIRGKVLGNTDAS